MVVKLDEPGYECGFAGRLTVWRGSQRERSSSRRKTMALPVRLMKAMYRPSPTPIHR